MFCFSFALAMLEPKIRYLTEQTEEGREIERYLESER